MTTELLTPPGAERIRGRTAIALGVVVSFWALVLADEMIVNISLAQLGESLRLTETELSWVINAYLLPFGGLLLLGGRLGDVLGKRRVFIAGLALFTLGCLLRAVAPDAWLVIAARATQGTGAALATPCVLGLIVSMFAEGSLRRRAIGVYTVVGGAGAAVGLLLVGVLGTITSWRVVLLVGGVLGLVMLAVAAPVIGETPRRPGRFDVTGALLSTAGLVAVVYGLTNSQSDGWRDPWVLLPLAGGVLLFGSFVARCRRIEQPLLDLGLFGDRGRVGGYLVLMLLPGAQIGLFFYLSLFFQMIVGYPPLVVALAFLTVSVAMLAVARPAERLMVRAGGRVVAALGGLLLAAANLWLLGLDPGDSFWLGVLPSLLVLGAGMVFVMIAATFHATSGVDSEQGGSAASVVNAGQNVGSSLSLAIIVAVAATAGARATAEPPAGTPPEAVPGYAFAEAMSAVFVTGTVFALLIAVAAVLIRPARQD